jgi:hypothetical protein
VDKEHLKPTKDAKIEPYKKRLHPKHIRMQKPKQALIIFLRNLILFFLKKEKKNLKLFIKKTFFFRWRSATMMASMTCHF